ncbi:MAG: hypothetical protein GY765_29265 [bacterium]|nr:hypothetical protein [bacterium]
MVKVNMSKASQMVEGLKRHIETPGQAGVKPEYVVSAEGLLIKMKRTHLLEPRGTKTIVNQCNGS